MREAGGLYQWANTTLIRLAGPPQLSPNVPRDRGGDPCAHCGRPRREHRESGDALLCPGAH